MRSFRLLRPDQTTAADGYVVFDRYVVSWRGEPPQYRIWPSIDVAISAHKSEHADLTVSWL